MAKAKKTAKTVKRKAPVRKAVKPKAARTAAAKLKVFSGELKPCDPTFCEKNREDFRIACQDSRWPPGHKVVVVKGGDLCFCTCP